MSKAPRPSHGLTRRGLLVTAGAGVAGAGLGAAGAELDDGSNPAAPARIPFHGPHQAGIATPPQDHVALGVFDLTAGGSELQDLLRTWSHRAAELTRSSNAALTLTAGLGPSLFSDASGSLGPHGPARLAELPAFRGDALERRHSGGDVCLQACADDAQAAFSAVHALARAAEPVATLRRLQHGFRQSSGGSNARNLFGFRDGARNLDPADDAAMRRHVWAGRADQPWFRGGTYLVVRRIRMLLDEWDSLPAADQERIFGRTKTSDRPLADDPTDLPRDAHIRVAAPEANGGVRLLRRSYSYSDGVDPATRQLDAGMLFISFQADPAQFVTIQRRLSYGDALGRHLVHTGSAIFACLPGVRRGGYLGEQLFRAAA